MGQKIHPVGLRLGITRTWESRWFEKKNYKAWLHEDQAVRKYFGRLTRAAAISKVEIERRANQARVIVHTAKPGIIIGKRGVGIEDIRKNLEHLTKKNIQVNVVEIKHPELDARLVGQNIVDQLEKRIAFRRAMKQAIMRTMKAGAKGVKVMVSGRLGGAEIARSEQNHDGKVPLHTLRADIDYAHVEAFTTYGRIGCKVWIYKGEVMPDQPREQKPERPVGERATFRDRRNDRRGGRGPSSGAPRALEAGDIANMSADDLAMEAAMSAPAASAPAPVVSPAPVVAPTPVEHAAPAPSEASVPSEHAAAAPAETTAPAAPVAAAPAQVEHAAPAPAEHAAPAPAPAEAAPHAEAAPDAATGHAPEVTE